MTLDKACRNQDGLGIARQALRVLPERSHVDYSTLTKVDISVPYEAGSYLLGGNAIREEDSVFLDTVRASAQATTYETLTPETFTRLCNMVRSGGVEPVLCIYGYHAWCDMMSTSEFFGLWVPEYKQELNMCGYLGHIMGTRILTDAVRIPAYRAVQPGEIFLFPAPESVGLLLDQKRLTVENGQLVQKAFLDVRFGHQCVYAKRIDTEE